MKMSFKKFLIVVYIYLAAISGVVIAPNVPSSVGDVFLVTLALPIIVWPAAIYEVLAGFFDISTPLIVVGWEFGAFTSLALILLVFLVPFLTILAFFVENKDDVPFAYYWLSPFITDSAAKYLTDENWNVEAFRERVEKGNYDRYQARMEIKRLKDAAAAARAEAKRMNSWSEQRMRQEEERIKAAEDAATAAEEKFRATARERATRR